MKIKVEEMSDAEQTIDIVANRSAKKYSNYELVLRILWGVGAFFFRLTPRNFFSMRVWILRLFGAKVGRQVHIYNSAVIYFPWNLSIGDFSSVGEWALIYNLGKVNIGSQSTISHKVQLCAGTHDYTELNLPLLKKDINIGNQVWVCTQAFISPGITVGDGAVVGACSVVTKNVREWSVVAGNPAIFIKQRILK